MNKYMQKSFVLAVFLALLIFSCYRQEEHDKQKNELPEQSFDRIYRYYWGEKGGFKIWIVDGSQVRINFFSEFLYGGNNERYPFVPEREIWIDNSVSSEEFETTLAHEINERNLMAGTGMTYFDAHASSLSLEVSMRRNWDKICRAHEEHQPKVSPTDFDSTQEIEDLPEMIKLK